MKLLPTEPERWTDRARSGRAFEDELAATLRGACAILLRTH